MSVDSSLDWRIRIYGGALGGAGRRKISVAIRKRIIAQQSDRCLYCDLPIGTVVWRNGLPVVLRRAWDHYMPLAFLGRNPHDNWVLACHVCNGIKHASIYANLAEAKEKITARRLELGYAAPSLVDALGPEVTS